ncbi:hypothetical protein RclHR1_01410018 [Rhizophagus clarus]|uniref:Uncharacterized protein n=1 Tax=Rhizophagus clarus TaxID=94130 RepID=A0A2Z6QDK5_9GLOM|nr:hypothetical protein RclHR1_01410018 [Rhizophagus clarus]
MSQTSSSKRQLHSHITKTYKNNSELDAAIAQDSYAIKHTTAQPYDIENSKTKKLKTIQKNKDITSTSLPDNTTYMEDVIDTHDTSIVNNPTTENSQARLSYDKNDNQQAQNQSENSTSKTSSLENQTLRSTPKLATDEMIELLDLEILQENPLEYKHYELFIPRDSFSKENKTFEILNFIKNAFVNKKDFFKIHTTKHLTYEIFILRFIKEETKNKYKNELHPVIQKPLYDYTNKNVHTLIQKKLEDISNRSIRLVDIPHKLDFNLIIAHLANITGVSITHHKDITPKQKPTNKKSPQQANRKRPIRPPLKQLLDINNKYRHIISPERKTRPIPPITTSLNQNGKRPIVLTNSNNHPDVNANARTPKQQPSIQPHLNAMHEKRLTEANEKISKLENALNTLSTKYEMLEQQIKMIHTQHNTQNTSIDNLKQNFFNITKQVDNYQTTQLTINNKLDFIIEKISKNSPTPSHHSTYSHKTPYEHIARKQYNDDSLHLNNLSKYQEIVPEMDIDYNQHQQEDTETHYGISSQLDHKSGYGPTNPKSDTDTDNHTIDAVVHPSELPIDSNCSGIFGLPSFF